MIISPYSLAMMNTVNTEFSSVEVWFTNEVGKALEKHYKNEIFDRTKIQKIR